MPSGNTISELESILRSSYTPNRIRELEEEVKQLIRRLNSLEVDICVKMPCMGTLNCNMCPLRNHEFSHSLYQALQYCIRRASLTDDQIRNTPDALPPTDWYIPELFDRPSSPYGEDQ